MKIELNDNAREIAGLFIGMCAAAGLLLFIVVLVQIGNSHSLEKAKIAIEAAKEAKP